MMVVHLLWEQADWVRVPAARQVYYVSHETNGHTVKCRRWAHSKVVLRGIRIAEARVRFPVSPQKQGT